MAVPEIPLAEFNVTKSLKLMNQRLQKGHPLLQPVELPRPLPTKVYGAMLAVWHLRPAMQRRFPLQKGRARDWVRFLSWCATDGRRDYKILREISDWDEELHQMVTLPSLKNDPWEGCFSLGMLFSGVATYRWSFSALLKTKRARSRISKAYWRGRRHEIGLSTIPEWQMVALGNRFKSIYNFIDQIRFLKRDRLASPDELIVKYQLESLRGICPQSLNSCEPKSAGVKLHKGINVSPVPIPLRAMRVIAPVVQFFKRNPTEEQRAAVTALSVFQPPSACRLSGDFGVNLFGYANGELGIGEDIRQVALALQLRNVPVCIINFKPGGNISLEDRSADALVAESPKYSFNLFCMTGIETARYVCERGLEALKGRYNIGLWPWELPDWPESCRYAYASVDEVWGISKYTAQAHRHGSPRPIVPMTLPVELGPVSGQRRRDFGLPEEAYLYYFAFDINSNAARKNPDGLIEAFQRAFPNGSPEDVGLVLKISHPETGCALWKKIRRIAALDQRIHIIERTMRRPELLALFSVCDCLVSLHRAEGFGRCIAEALLLGKQVVATGFSGNLDFCHEPRVSLVKHKMKPVQSGDYMWGEGQSWADPDLDHAAELMRSVKKNPCEISPAHFDFAPENVGRRYTARLQELWNQLHDGVEKMKTT